MLIRQYQHIAEKDDSLFVIQNAPSYNTWRFADADPTDQELAAPGLTIRLLTGSEDERRRFWNSIFFGDLSHPPVDIIDALRGLESPWKITRCEPYIQRRDGSGVFITLIDPAKYSHNNRLISWEGEEGIKHGCLWLYLIGGDAYDREFDILAKRQEGGHERYTVTLLEAHRFEFIEYNTDGSIKRYNRAHFADDDPESYKLNVDIIEYA